MASRSLLALTSAVSLLASLPGVAHANSFGNAFSTGPVTSGTTILQANSTLILPDTPNPVANELSLWVGMGMSNGDLIQALAVSYPGTNNGAACGDVGSNWCILASVLQSGAGGQTEPPADMQVVAYPGDEVTMSYIYDESTSLWNQFVYVNGALVSTLSSSEGAQAQGWGTAEECQPGTPCGVMPEHQWINTVLVMSEAQDYGSTQGETGATGTITSSDGGTTWTVDTITIDQYDFTTGQ